MRSIGPSTPAARIKAARLAAKLTQPQVALSAGVSQPTVSDAERNDPPVMTAVTLHKICAALGISMHYVMTGETAAEVGHEREALRLLRSAPDPLRDAALRALRAMLSEPAGKQESA